MIEKIDKNKIVKKIETIPIYENPMHCTYGIIGELKISKKEKLKYPIMVLTYNERFNEYLLVKIKNWQQAKKILSK